MKAGHAILAALAAVLLVHEAAQGAELPPEFWDRPRSAQAVLAQPVIWQAVAVLQSRSDTRLRIVHGPHQEAVLQAEELRAWLIALAVENTRVLMRAETAAAVIRLEIVD
jgi:hypothetical protein